jgi:hypothetical protein
MLLKHPTPGRWSAPGIPEALEAVALAMAAGFGPRAAARRVADAIRAYWQTRHIDGRPGSVEEQVACRYLQLERVIYDAHRHRG